MRYRRQKLSIVSTLPGFTRTVPAGLSHARCSLGMQLLEGIVSTHAPTPTHTNREAVAGRRNDYAADVARYYASKLEAHGKYPRGVDWNGEAGQAFCLTAGAHCRLINDLGCGYGALLTCAWLRLHRHRRLPVGAWPQLRSKVGRGTHSRAARIDREADYMSRVEYSRSSEIVDTRSHEATLDMLNAARVAVASLNCLTSYSMHQRCATTSYYAGPMRPIDLCKRRYSKSACASARLRLV